MTSAGVLAAYARVERFGAVGSTNDIVRAWLADGQAEVCVAVADEQTAGRGRNGRAWTAPTGAALLCSIGFRPTWLDAAATWRLGGITALAMADAAEDAAGLAEGTIRLKWPNDLVVVAEGGGAALVGDMTAEEALAVRGAPLALKKIAGILGETEGLGTEDPRAVVGIGINADWKAAAFPAELAHSMTSLSEVSGGRPIDRETLLDGFLGRLETRLAALQAGRFDVAGWTDRQVTTGHIVTIVGTDGTRSSARALGVDGASGALVLGVTDGAGDVANEGPDVATATGERLIFAGEVAQLRIASVGQV